MTISSGRYNYHLQDIAKAEADDANPMQAMMLPSMKAEAAAFEAENPEEAAEIQAQVKKMDEA